MTSTERDLDTEVTETETAEPQAEGAPAPVPTPRDDRLPDPERRDQVAEGVLAARAAGWSRTALEEASGFTPAQLWRMEQGRVHLDEVDAITDVLTRIADGELKPPPGARGGARPALDRRLTAAREVLEAVPERASRAQLADAVAAALAALVGDAQSGVKIEVSAESEPGE